MIMHLRILTITLLLCTFSPIFAANGSKPNVLFIITDDQSYDTIRSLGHTDIDTPNLDRLTAQGTTFTHAYNMGSWSGAVCVASRRMLISGRSLWHAAAPNLSLKEQSAAGKLWPQRMAARGYETYMSGKWHLDADAATCFQHTVHVRPGMPRDHLVCYDRPVVGKPDPWNPSDPKFEGFWKDGKHWSEVLGDDSVAFIENAMKSQSPFFMYLAFNAPHDPRQSPKEFVDRYPLDRIEIPKSYMELYPEKDRIGCGPDLRDEKLAPFPRTEHAVKVHRQEYYAIITHMDAQLGRILNALQESEKANNTWIIFTSDHGLACGHHGLMGKQNMYDHSIRVPFIIAGPGVKAGEKISKPVYLQSAMATALDLAGADLTDIEFQSLLPILKGDSTGLDAVYGAYLDLQRSVTDDGWKLILYPEAKVSKLFNLEKDPDELRNLASDPSTLERRKKLFAKLQALQKNLADPLDLKDVYKELNSPSSR